MPRGGARTGAGRKADAAKLARRLSGIQETMKAEFYASMGELGKSLPKLTQKAIALAAEGNVLLLKFLIENFCKVVGALPEEGDIKYRLIREIVEKRVTEYNDPSDRPEPVDSGGEGHLEAVENLALPESSPRV